MTQDKLEGPRQPDLSAVVPYGDTLGDGQIQMSFSLPVPAGERAREAARRVAKKMGMDKPQVYHMKDLGEGYTFFIVYARCRETVDFETIEVAQVETEKMSYGAINEYIRQELGREITVLGACTGDDAHSVGIDAIMNMKGYAGEYGLERYPMIEAVNLGMQVKNEELIRQAVERNADALLVSQVVTQNDSHIKNLSELSDMLEAEGMRADLVVVCGGPRISHELALELGFDAGFGPGTTAPDVASFVAQEMVARGLG